MYLVIIKKISIRVTLMFQGHFTCN